MCGIFCKYTRATCARNNKRAKARLKDRGPDASHNISLTLPGVEGHSLEMEGHTLWTQGDRPVPQPVDSQIGSLLFNGDLFGVPWVGDSCDTIALHAKMDEAAENNEIPALLDTLRGPFCVIYFHKRRKRLYFCRDRIGRRSILVHQSPDGLILSSVLGRSYDPSFELPANKIYCFDLNDETLEQYPWTNVNSHERLELSEWICSLQNPDETVEDDSTSSLSHITEEDSILLVALEEASKIHNANFDFLNATMRIPILEKTADELIERLSTSVKHRVGTQPSFCSVCVKTLKRCDAHCTVGILFSGGLDCTILAALAERFLPEDEEIDLLNVAFDRKSSDNFDTPDRITSRLSCEKLKMLFPKRKWNLLEINITDEELRRKQRESIADLIFPLKTILDESLGSALWFAARGVTATGDRSNCRILLTGIGADELFGGYTRHRNEFRRRGWESLSKELQFDWRRIASRNLARDDRIISGHGRQPRMPYLDEDFINFTLRLKPWQRCYPSDLCKAGAGDKLLLRLCAVKLGLIETAIFPKRAIQFGSRIALKKDNAKDISQNLL